MKKTIVWRYHHFTHVYQKLWSHDVWFLRYGAQQTNGATDENRDDQEKWHIELAALLENLINGPINRKTFSRITYVYAIFMLFLYMCEPNLTNIYHNDVFVLQKHKSILTLQRPGFFEGQNAGGLYWPTTCHFKSNEKWQEHSSSCKLSFSVRKKILTVQNFADISKKSAKICQKACHTKLTVTFDWKKNLYPVFAICKLSKCPFQKSTVLLLFLW